MKINFKLSEFLGKNGQGESDLTDAKEYAHELCTFALSQKKIILEFVDLTQIMSTDSKKILKDCLVAIKHIYSALKELVDMFIRTPLNDVFNTALNEVATIKKDSKEKVKKLLSNVS